MSGKHAGFVDTNAFLHYQWIGDTDWRREWGASSVILVVAPVVLRELEHHKLFATNEKLRQRAEDTSARLFTYVGSTANTGAELRPGVQLLLLVHDAVIDFAANHLSPHVNDDYLLASMLEYREQNPDETVVLLAADSSLRLKAMAMGFETRDPAGRLPSAPSKLEKENRELREELQCVKSRMPVLTLGFREGESVLRAPLRKPLTEAEVERHVGDRMRGVLARHPKLVTASQSVPGEGGDEHRHLSILERSVREAQASIFRMATPHVEKYNTDLDSFYAKSEAYIRGHIQYVEYRRQLVQIDIMLRNEGTATAVGIEVTLTFPIGVQVFDKHSLRPEPKEPKPPNPPSPLSGFGVGSLDLLRSTETRALLPPVASGAGQYEPPPNISRPVIDPGEPHDVWVQVQKAKHGFSYRIARLWMALPGDRDVRNFAIRYSIHSESLVDVVTGRLHVVTDGDGDTAS